MRKLQTADLEAYLHLLDAKLSEGVTLIIIGGAAVALQAKTGHATSDVDLMKNPGPAFWKAVEECAGHPGALPIEYAGVTSPPYNYEDRLLAVALGPFTHISVQVPERHDLAMLKVVRGLSHDLEAIEDLHRQAPLSLPTLHERYVETLDTLIGRPETFKESFLALVGRLYGDDEADRLRRALETGA